MDKKPRLNCIETPGFVEINSFDSRITAWQVLKEKSG